MFCETRAALTLLGFCFVGCTSVAQTSVLTWHHDNLRSGANTSETLLTSANVNYKMFGKPSTKPDDGYIVAHPLSVFRT